LGAGDHLTIMFNLAHQGALAFLVPVVLGEFLYEVERLLGVRGESPGLNFIDVLLHALV